MSVNKVILVGRLGKDPVRRQTRDMKEYSYFSVATSKKIKGEEKTTWHNVTVWSENNARYINSYACKGTLVYLEGEIENRQYDKDGVTMYASDVVVGAFNGVIQILKDGVPRGEERSGPDYAEAKGGEKARARAKPPEAAPANLENDLDDFIPF